jgi:hypothetical protein
MTWAVLHTAALGALFRLGIVDLLASGPKTADELAAAAGAHPGALYRALRTLSAKEVFAEDEEGRFHLTAVSALLRSDGPSFLRGMFELGTLVPFMEATLAIDHSLKTGLPAFDHRHGAPVFEYLKAHSPLDEYFAKGMAGISDGDNAAVAASYDFSGASRVIDVGGGLGGLLVEVLERNPSVRGVLYDRAEILAKPGRVTAAGLDDRVERVTGSFFDSVPEGGDIYLIKRVLHDWDDKTCVSILKNCRRAMSAGGRVLVVDDLVPPGNGPHPSKPLDLYMLVLLPGRERTEREMAALFEEAGLKLARVIPTQASVMISEGVPA